jgi:hypothetical protein
MPCRRVVAVQLKIENRQPAFAKATADRKSFGLVPRSPQDTD